MSRAFANAVAALEAVARRFDADASTAKHAALARLAGVPLTTSAALLRCHDALLFLAAHPCDAALARAVQRQFVRLTAHLKAHRGRLPAVLDNQGLPFTDTVTRFSHDCLRWLLSRPECRVTHESWNEPTLELNEVLAVTLPSVERSETTAGLSNDELLRALRVPQGQGLRFVVDELARLDALPLVKDLLFDRLELYVRVSPTSRALSKAWSRLPLAGPPFHQAELLRRFDPKALMNQRLPRARALDGAALDQAIAVIRHAMVLTGRETDPASYLDARALRIFDLERGLSVAVFGMTPQRQLPLESYVGFTLFKNGLAVAYGGAWLFGPRAAFGMNIFEPYRGGESGFMMCQVLRVYRQAFGIRFFEVDAHQFGLDNPDGIATGAYWFYYRHGFRSLDRTLAALAEREQRRIAAGTGHRSSDKTLIALTGSNVALNFGGPVPRHPFDFTVPVTAHVQRRHGGDRAAAEAAAERRFVERVRLPARLNSDEQRVLVEVALVAEANRIDRPDRLALLARMVRTKPVDLFAYQRLWLQYFHEAA